MKVAILKYNGGNVQSVQYALERIGVQGFATDDPEQLKCADKIIFPGVGEASSAINYLKERRLDEVCIALKQPVLGICLGMQLMCKSSEEGDVNCLGIFDSSVNLFSKVEIGSGRLKVPQIGWNKSSGFDSPIFKGVSETEYFYFVHSYYATLGNCTVAKSVYGVEYSSALQKNNFYGVQFHPEKSGSAGQKIIENFIKM